MEYNAVFSKKWGRLIFVVMTFLIAIAFILPSYATGAVKMVEGIIENVINDNKTIIVKGNSYNVSKAVLTGPKGVSFDKRDFKSGLKVHIYLDSGIVKEVIVFGENTPE